MYIHDSGIHLLPYVCHCDKNAIVNLPVKTNVQDDSLVLAWYSACPSTMSGNQYSIHCIMSLHSLSLSQYAHKLAFLVGQSLHRAPSLDICDRLFFL